MAFRPQLAFVDGASNPNVYRILGNQGPVLTVILAAIILAGLSLDKEVAHHLL